MSDNLTEKQSRLESLIETNVNVFSGWFLSLMVWSFAIGPLFGIETSMLDNMAITLIFTAISVVRGYYWRRFFANGLHKVIVKWVKKYYANKGYWYTRLRKIW